MNQPPASPPATRAVILVVDDEDDQRELLRTHLQRTGHRVLTASSGSGGLALAHAAEPSLIFLDLLIPDIDGWELCARFRQMFPACPVVITSVLEPEHYPQAAGVLPKPYTRDQLTALISTHLPSEEVPH